MPEVETIRRNLQETAAGRRIRSVEIHSPHCLAMAAEFAPDVFVHALEGRRFEGFSRRGKYLLADLSGGVCLVIHLRMTGRLVHLSRGAAPPADMPPRHVHVVFHLDDGSRLVFYDPRKFGRLYLGDREKVGAQGPEPLDPAFTPDVLAGILKGTRARVKAVLLNQAALAGLGNIYADEALHRAGIHPAREAAGLTAEEVFRLWEAIRTVLTEGIAHRGTTFSDYRDGKGEPGGFAALLQVYGREGRSCLRCGAAIERTKVAGRSSFHCPRCQPPSPGTVPADVAMGR